MIERIKMHASLTLPFALLLLTVGRLRHVWRQRATDTGASTLELVILILGLITVATLLVAVLIAAVRTRTNQIT